MDERIKAVQAALRKLKTGKLSFVEFSETVDALLTREEYDERMKRGTLD
jgi:hypothetical protein